MSNKSPSMSPSFYSSPDELIRMSDTRGLAEHGGMAMDPITLSIIASAIGSGVQAVGGLISDNQNRKEARRQQREAREMAERQFAWGQGIDRFNMGMANEQLAEAQKMNRHSITQSRLDRLNQVLRTNVELQNQFRAMYGARR